MPIGSVIQPQLGLDPTIIARTPRGTSNLEGIGAAIQTFAAQQQAQAQQKKEQALAKFKEASAFMKPLVEATLKGGDTDTAAKMTDALFNSNPDFSQFGELLKDAEITTDKASFKIGIKPDGGYEYVDVTKGEGGFTGITAPDPTLSKNVESKTTDTLISEGFTKATEGQLANSNLSNKTFMSADGNKMIKLQRPTAALLEKINVMNTSMESLGASVKEMQEKGLSPDPITEEIPLVGEFILKFTKSPEWQAWRTGVNKSLLNFMRIETGVARSDKEIQRLKAVWANSADFSDEVFAKKAISIFNDINRLKKNHVNLLENQGFDVSGFRPSLEAPLWEGGPSGVSENVQKTKDALNTGAQAVFDALGGM